MAAISLRSALPDTETVSHSGPASSPQTPVTALDWALTISSGDHGAGTSAVAGLMPTPPPGGTVQNPPALSPESLLMDAAIREPAILRVGGSTSGPATAVTEEGAMAAVAPAEATAPAAPPGAAPADPVVANDSATAAGSDVAAQPDSSSVRSTLEDLDRLSGLA
jgi:hypothetical protein